MAQIDLKYAKIFISDGSTRTAAVNNGAGYSSGTTMIIDTITGIIEVDTQFTVAGETDSPIHTVTAHNETGSDTRSITFTPAISSAIVDNAVISIQARRLEINIGEGNLSYTEKRDITYVRNRGRLSTVRLGDEQPVEISLDFIWEHITASVGDTPTIEECIKGQGAASNWVSSGADLCEPYAVDIEVVYTPPCSTEEMETITLQDFRWEELDHNFKDATVAVKGKCNITEAVAVRDTNTYPN